MILLVAAEGRLRVRGPMWEYSELLQRLGG